MADEKAWKGGRLGPFSIGRRYKDKDVGPDLGRLYEAHNVRTGAAALVLMPGKRVDWEPEESWQVRASSHATPAYVALEVERAPTSGKVSELAQLLDLITSAIERVEENAQARAHLTSRSVGFMKRWVGRLRRLVRSRRGLAVAGMAFFAVGAGLWLGFSGGTGESGSEMRTNHGVAQDALAQVDAPTLVDEASQAGAVIAYPLPNKPFRNQAKAPCKSESEVEINGGCWVELARRPPCASDHAEYKGKCYLPMSKNRGRDESQSIHP